MDRYRKLRGCFSALVSLPTDSSPAPPRDPGATPAWSGSRADTPALPGETGSRSTIIWPRVAGIGTMSFPCPRGSRGRPFPGEPRTAGVKPRTAAGPAASARGWGALSAPARRPRAKAGSAAGTRTPGPPSHPGTDPRTRTPRPTPGPAPAAPCGRATTQGPAPPKLSRGRAGARPYLRETPWAARRGPARSGPRALPPSSPPLRPLPGRGGREVGGGTERATRNAPPPPFPPGTLWRAHAAVPGGANGGAGQQSAPWRRDGECGPGTPRGAGTPVGLKTQSETENPE